MLKTSLLLLMLCTACVSAQESDSDTQDEQATESTPSILSTRFEADDEALSNLFSITQYRQNYILPISYVSNPGAVGDENLTAETVDHKEAKFQISVKLPLYLKEKTADGLYFGFTLTSFWQLYNKAVSAPFRETNYEPEIFYQRRATINILGYDFNAFQFGFNHMSNGQSGLRSRSWNRLYASVLFSDYDDVYYLKTWYRLPEEAKTFVDDPAGDDNPDIEDYYGRFEFAYGTRVGDVKLLASFRNNLKIDGNKGSVGINLTYPLSNRYELLLHYFNGYGDSLIDYNRHQQRIGLGVQLIFL